MTSIEFVGTLSAVAPAPAFLQVVSIRVTSDMGSMSNYGHSGRLKITYFTNPSILFLAEMGNLIFPITPPSTQRQVVVDLIW